MSGCVILDSGIVARKNGKRLPCEVLQAENAKLREERDCWKKLCVDQEVAHVRRAEYLESENASLRELCETFGMIANDQVCDYYERDKMLARANVDARELGVEL